MVPAPGGNVPPQHRRLLGNEHVPQEQGNAVAIVSLRALRERNDAIVHRPVHHVVRRALFFPGRIQARHTLTPLSKVRLVTVALRSPSSWPKLVFDRKSTHEETR